MSDMMMTMAAAGMGEAHIRYARGQSGVSQVKFPTYHGEMVRSHWGDNARWSPPQFRSNLAKSTALDLQPDIEHHFRLKTVWIESISHVFSSFMEIIQAQPDRIRMNGIGHLARLSLLLVFVLLILYFGLVENYKTYFRLPLWMWGNGDNRYLHIVGFGLLAFVALLGSRNVRLTLLLLLLLAAALECIQLLVPTRTADLLDFASSLAGILIGGGLAYLLHILAGLLFGPNSRDKLLSDGHS